MKRILTYLLLIASSILFIIPVVLTVILSFKSGYSISLHGYFELLLNYFLFYPMFWNSVFYAGVITLLQLIVIVPCAFGFVFAKFKLKNTLYIFYIMLMMMPLQVTILPNYIGLREFDLLDTRLGIILPMIFSPFGVIVMHQYMKSIDDSVIEAMRMETNSIIRVIITAVVPQLRVCIFAVVLFVFADCWNMVEQPLLFLRNNNLKTLTVFLSNLLHNSSGTAIQLQGLPIIYAASVIFMIPIFLLYLFFSEYLDKGLDLNIFTPKN